MKKHALSIFALLMLAALLASCALLPGLPSQTGLKKTSPSDFLYELDSSSETYAIVGLAESGKDKEMLVIPASYTGSDGVSRPVNAIDEGAFAGCTVAKTVVVGPRSVDFISLGASAYANSSIESIYLFVPCGTFGAGSIRTGNADLKVYISSEYYSDYTVDYSWADVIYTSPELNLETTKSYESVISDAN